MSRSAWQLWANYLAEDLETIEASNHPTQSDGRRYRLELLQEFGRAVQRAAQPDHPQAQEPAEFALGPTDTPTPAIDADQEQYAIAVWLGNAGTTHTAIVTWAGKIEQVATSALDANHIPHELHQFTDTSLTPFLRRLERLDEAPDEDFVTLALERSAGASTNS